MGIGIDDVWSARVHAQHDVPGTVILLRAEVFGRWQGQRRPAITRIGRQKTLEVGICGRVAGLIDGRIQRLRRGRSHR